MMLKSTNSPPNLTCACHDSHHMTNRYHSLPIPHPSLPQNASVEDRQSQTTFPPSRLNNYTNMYGGTIISQDIIKNNHYQSLRCLRLRGIDGQSLILPWGLIHHTQIHVSTTFFDAFVTVVQGIQLYHPQIHVSTTFFDAFVKVVQRA